MSGAACGRVYMLHKFLAPSKLTARAAESLVTNFRSNKLHSVTSFLNLHTKLLIANEIRSNKLHSVTSYLNLHTKLLIANEEWQMEAISAARETVGKRLQFQGFRATISLFTGEGLKPVA